MITEPFYVNIVNAIKQAQVAPDREFNIESGTPLWQSARIHHDHIYGTTHVEIKHSGRVDDADDRIA